MPGVGGMDLRTLRIVWLAMIGGTALYTCVLLALVGVGVIPDQGFEPTVLRVAAGLAFVLMLFGLLMRRHLVSQAVREPDPEKRFEQYATASIIGLALLEAGGLMLITLGVAGLGASWILVGGACAVVLMLMARPTPAEAGLDAER